MSDLYKSWRTALAGIGQFFIVLGMTAKAYFDNDPTTVPDLDVLVASFGAMLGLILARDNQVSSEEAGIMPPPGTLPK